MTEREIFAADILYVLKNGFIYDEPEEATREGYFKYTMINPTPSSDKRELKIVVIPSIQSTRAKVATVMWKDEPIIRG